MVEFYIDGKQWYKTLLELETDGINYNERSIDIGFVPFEDALLVLRDDKKNVLHRSYMVNLIDRVKDAKNKNCVLYVIAYCTINNRTIPFSINAYKNEEETEVFFDPLKEEYISKYFIFDGKGIEKYNRDKHESIAIGIFNELWLIIEACQQKQSHYKYMKEYERHKLNKIPLNVKYTSVNLKNIECRFTKEVDNRLEETRRYTRHIEAWYCRGYERHYKSGKVTWVKPHIRGKGTVKDTKYEVK